MATNEHVRQTERIIEYRFANAEYAIQALTAAGANEQNHDGNRMFARYGKLFIELYVLDRSYLAGATRGERLSDMWRLYLLTCLRDNKQLLKLRGEQAETRHSSKEHRYRLLH